MHSTVWVRTRQVHVGHRLLAAPDAVEEVLLQHRDLFGRLRVGEVLGHEVVGEKRFGLQFDLVALGGEMQGGLLAAQDFRQANSLTVVPATTRVRPLGNSASRWVVSVISRSVETLRVPVHDAARKLGIASNT